MRTSHKSRKRVPNKRRQDGTGKSSARADKMAKNFKHRKTMQQADELGDYR